MESDQNSDMLALTADIVSSHVANNSVAVSDLPILISSIYTALSRLGASVEPAPVKQEPAVAIRNSVKPDYIVCLEDGKKLKMLKRHLMTSFGMTPEQYRAKWHLPADYPMVAPNYAATRRELALGFGLGTKRLGGVARPAPRGKAKPGA